MSTPAETWNSRYAGEGFQSPAAPSSFLREVLPFLPAPSARTRALDLAAGVGHNAVELAFRGWRTVAVDVSTVALERIAALAQSRHVVCTRARGLVPSAFEGLRLVEADLERLALPAASFDLILCFRYLQRSLFSGIAASLRPRGLLVFETFTTDQLAFAKGPHSPEHLLHPGELRAAFPDLDCLFYREWTAGEGMASLLARKPQPL
jgi:tellurite methyltransferase